MVLNCVNLLKIYFFFKSNKEIIKYIKKILILNIFKIQSLIFFKKNIFIQNLIKIFLIHLT